ncbi:hypothetical protein [Solidesulfovibrio sp.]
MPPSASSPPANARSAAASRRCRRALGWTAGYLALTVPFEFFSYTLYSYLPYPFDFLLPTLFFLLNTLLILFALGVVIYNFRAPRFCAFYPLILTMAIFAILSQTNTEKINIATFHALFHTAKEQMVHDFCTGKLHLEKKYFDDHYAMPDDLSHLTLSNYSVKILCNNNQDVASFTLFGLLGHSTEIVYRSDDSWPDDPNDGYKSVDRIEKNWFLVTQ